MSESPIFYNYLYLDPRKPGNFKYDDLSFEFEPFYVGKGKNKRIINHLNSAYLQHNSYKNNKIKKIISEGYEPVIIKISNNLIEEEALELEKNLISKIGRSNLGNGPLTNLTNGGEGMSGYKHTEKSLNKMKQRKVSEENKKKQSEKMKSKDYYFDFLPKDCSGSKNGMFNKNHSEESRQKMSETRKANYKIRYWWNNGKEEVMSELPPSPDFIKGRFQRPRNNLGHFA